MTGRGGNGVDSAPGSRSARPPDVPAPRDPAWPLLVREIQTCTKCPLHRNRTHAVVYRGGGSPRIVFVGEAPGAEEDRVGLPFVGRSGRRLDAAVETLGLRDSEYGVLNLIKCRPPRNRFDPAAARACRPYLDRQLDLLRPGILVTLGARALSALDPAAPRVLLAAGTPRAAGKYRIFPLIHPAAALRSTTLAGRWSHDVAALKTWLAA
jgi:uracil-DNA glycosylase